MLPKSTLRIFIRGILFGIHIRGLSREIQRPLLALEQRTRWYQRKGLTESTPNTRSTNERIRSRMWQTWREVW